MGEQQGRLPTHSITKLNTLEASCVITSIICNRPPSPFEVLEFSFTTEHYAEPKPRLRWSDEVIIFYAAFLTHQGNGLFESVWASGTNCGVHGEASSATSVLQAGLTGAPWQMCSQLGHWCLPTHFWGTTRPTVYHSLSSFPWILSHWGNGMFHFTHSVRLLSFEKTSSLASKVIIKSSL